MMTVLKNLLLIPLLILQDLAANGYTAGRLASVPDIINTIDRQFKRTEAALATAATGGSVSGAFMVLQQQQAAVANGRQRSMLDGSMLAQRLQEQQGLGAAQPLVVPQKQHQQDQEHQQQQQQQQQQARQAPAGGSMAAAFAKLKG